MRTNGTRNRKLAAIAAGLMVLGIGATYTLATWNDSEWTWAGFGDDEPGIGTSFFNVQQNATRGANGTFDDFETSPGNKLQFTIEALSLSPGSTTHAPLALRTQSGSTAGTVTLQGAVQAPGIATQDPDDVLWNAIEVSVYTSESSTPPACDDSFDALEWSEALLTSQPLTDPATTAQDLAADGGSTQHYCFLLTLPASSQQGASEELMNRSIAPAWEFAAESSE